MKHAKKLGLSTVLPVNVIDEKSLDAVIGGVSNNSNSNSNNNSNNSVANRKVMVGSVQLNSGATWGPEVK